MFDRDVKYETTVTMVTEQCCNCGIVFGMPSDLVKVLRNDPQKYFHCPNGHSQHYSKSALQVKLDNANREKERLLERLASEQSTVTQLEGVIKRKDKEHKRLVKNGVCPCCTRSFTNLKRHMQTKHPEYIK